MSSPAVIKFSDLSLSDVTFSDIRKNANNGKTIYLNGRGSSKLFLQLPKMKVPFGLGINEYDGKTSYSLPMAADDPAFVDFLKKFDDMVVAKVVENSETYLGKSMNETVVREALYTALFKPPSDEKYAPLFKTKILANHDGTFLPQVFTTDREPFDLNKLEKGQYVTAIVHIPSIWFVGTKFGVTIRLQQLRVTPSQKLTEYAFVDDDDDAEDESFDGESE